MLNKTLIACFLALSLSLAACGPAAPVTPPPTPTPAAVPTPEVRSDEAVFAELLAEVEAKNGGLDAPAGDLERYKYDFDQAGALLTREEWDKMDGAPEEMVRVLPIGDARAEADYLFRLLRTHYGLYTWFGGDETFGAAEARVLAGLEGREEITGANYQRLLTDSLDFLQDGHFRIGGRQVLEERGLYCAEEVLFDRRDGRFYGGADLDRVVETVNGGDPADCIKRAIGPDGALVWKLYLMDVPSVRSAAEVRYADGAETLILAPAGTAWSVTGTGQTFGWDTLAGVARVRVTGMPFGTDDQGPEWAVDEEVKTAFLASAGEALAYPAVVVDLTANPGGNGDLPAQWFQIFTGEEVEPNFCTLGLDPFGWGPRRGEREEGPYRVRRPAPQYLAREEGPLLITLTSRATASAAEGFTDLSRGVGRSLVVGSNTGGCLTNSQTWPEKHLPWSGLELSWGEDLFYWPEGYFQEGVGLEPDVYLTGADQEARLARFLERYIL